MTDYVKAVNFATKDALVTGDPLKVVKGAEINTELDNLATSIATKFDKAGGTITGATSITAALTLTSSLNLARGSIVQHATTMDLWALPNILDSTGSAVTITAIANAPQAGASRTVYFLVGTVITDGATFNVQGNASYTTKAGDALVFTAITTNTYYVDIVTADGTAIGTKQIQSITATASAGALTITLLPTSLGYRSATLTSGTITTVVNAANISTVISSGSTAGGVSAAALRLVILAINNAGVSELAWTNNAGGLNLDETGVITTVAEGGAGAADSASVIYSTTARTNVAYRVVGFLDITNTTAGTWLDPTTIQGTGGEALRTINKIVNTAVIATTSGTSIDFTGLPIWVKKITVEINGVSTNGISNVQIQLGTSAGVVTTGYVGSSDNQGSGGGTATSFTTGLGLERVATAAYIRQGLATFTLQPTNNWVGTYIGSSTGVLTVAFGATTISLAGSLDRVRLTTVNGTDTFDAGSISLLLE